MPRISLIVPKSLLIMSSEYVKRNDLEFDLLGKLVRNLTAIGDEPDIREGLQIAGSQHIWAHAAVNGWSNKKAVFGRCFMLDKVCRTSTVRHMFGERVQVVTQGVVCSVLKIDHIGIDMPITTVHHMDYIEEDDL